MEVRGRRRCKTCGKQWSYFETGEVSCPECGGLRSVGVDAERTLHTASSARLDLSPVRALVGEEPVRRLAELAAESCREFTRGYGFVHAGALQPLDDTFLTALELEHVGSELSRRLEVDETEEQYLLALLRANERCRPEPGEVPDSLRSLRGLAYANAVETYRSDVRHYLDASSTDDQSVQRILDRLSDHVRRVRALDGDVPPGDAERLVAVANDVQQALVEGDETALTRAESRLDTLS